MDAEQQKRQQQYGQQASQKKRSIKSLAYRGRACLGKAARLESDTVILLVRHERRILDISDRVVALEAIWLKKRI